MVMNSMVPVRCLAVRATVQFLRQVKINQYSSRISFTLGVRHDNVVLRYVPMKYLSVVVERSMRLNEITTCFLETL
jgi:hypothetical protein